MFEFDFFKLVILAMIGLLVLGPEKLPGLAAKLGHWMGRARSIARQLHTQLEQEVLMEEERQRRKKESSRPATPPPDAAQSATPVGTPEQPVHQPPQGSVPAEPVANPSASHEPHAATSPVDSTSAERAHD